MKAIHNRHRNCNKGCFVVLYPKDTEKWKQFTTRGDDWQFGNKLCCIPKIPKNESNSQHYKAVHPSEMGCVVSQRYRKMKAIHNNSTRPSTVSLVVLYPKDTEKWKQFTTTRRFIGSFALLCCIPKIPKNESNSQHAVPTGVYQAPLCCVPKIPKNESNSQPLDELSIHAECCVVSQRYRKMKAIHNTTIILLITYNVVLYPKDTEKWKQFTTQR